MKASYIKEQIKREKGLLFSYVGKKYKSEEIPELPVSIIKLYDESTHLIKIRDVDKILQGLRKYLIENYAFNIDYTVVTTRNDEVFKFLELSPNLEELVSEELQATIKGLPENLKEKFMKEREGGVDKSTRITISENTGVPHLVLIHKDPFQGALYLDILEEYLLRVSMDTIKEKVFAIVESEELVTTNINAEIENLKKELAELKALLLPFPLSSSNL